MCLVEGYFFIFSLNDIFARKGSQGCKGFFCLLNYSEVPACFSSQIGLIAHENRNGLSQIKIDVTLTSS
jgi:hypothetical protein